MKIIVSIKQVPDTSGKVAVNPDGTLNRASMQTITTVSYTHLIVCQDQIVFGAEDIEKSLQIDIFLKEMRKVRCMRHESTSRV